MGREPKQGMEGRSRDSHGQRANTGDGRQEQGQPWAESQRRERKASRNRAIGASAYARNGQQQGNWGKCLRTERTTARQQGQVLTHRTDSKAAWAESLRRVRKAAGQHGQRAFAGCGRQQGSMGREPSQGSAGLKKKAFTLLLAEEKTAVVFASKKTPFFRRLFFLLSLPPLFCYGTLP